MDTKIILILSIFLILSAVVQPVSATYLIDSGSRGIYDQNTGEKTGYWYYKTWNKGYYLHTYINGYLSGYGHVLYANIYMKKVSNSQMKYTVSYKFVNTETVTNTYNIPTSKSATSWYWNRPLIDSIKVNGYYKGGFLSCRWKYPG